jgi:hypothetical protein
MPSVKLTVLLVVGCALVLAACASEPDRQWYKPGRYTLAEFERDQKECTRQGTLDEACLRERGWLTLSADVQKGSKGAGAVPEREQSSFPRPASRY